MNKYTIVLGAAGLLLAGGITAAGLWNWELGPTRQARGTLAPIPFPEPPAGIARAAQPD